MVVLCSFKPSVYLSVLLCTRSGCALTGGCVSRNPPGRATYAYGAANLRHFLYFLFKANGLIIILQLIICRCDGFPDCGDVSGMIHLANSSLETIHPQYAERH